jgi:hypothetical protein
LVRANLGDEPRSSIVRDDDSRMTRVVCHERTHIWF